MQVRRKHSFLLTLALALLPIEASQLHAHDDLAWRLLADGDESRAEWFERLKTPAGESCCTLRDCRRTTAEWRGDTEGWWILVNGWWRPVPADKVLKSPRSIDGGAYVCMGEDSRGDMRDTLGSPTSLPGQIYCFVPPDLGS
jgi:hypothetical protein